MIIVFDVFKYSPIYYYIMLTRFRMHETISASVNCAGGADSALLSLPRAWHSNVLVSILKLNACDNVDVYI